VESNFGSNVYQKILIFNKISPKILLCFSFVFILCRVAYSQGLDTTLLDLSTPQFEQVKLPEKLLLRQNNIYRYPDYDNPRFRYLPEGMIKYFDIDPDEKIIYHKYYFWSNPIGYDYTIPLENYLSLRKIAIERELWDSLTKSYDLRTALSGGDIARILSQATGLTIPIPSNPIITIFGKPQISLNVNGEVNIRVGWRWDIQNLGKPNRPQYSAKIFA
jgi:hypothetical protein